MVAGLFSGGATGVDYGLGWSGLGAVYGAISGDGLTE